MAIQGLDASSVQGVLPWDQLVQTYQYMYFKCKQGNDGVDPDFAENCNQARMRGIAYGAYHFLYPLPHIDPVAEAEGFFAASGGLGKNSGDMPQAADLEWPAPKDWVHWGCSASQICDWSAKCLDQMDSQHGVETVVYLYPDFVNQLVAGGGDISFLRKRTRLWMAGGKHYGDGVLPSPGEVPPQPQGLTNIVMQQWDGNGGRRLPNGVDCDFDIFLGDLNAFNALRGIKVAVDTVGGPADQIEQLVAAGKLARDS